MHPDEMIPLVFALSGVALGGIIGPALSWITDGTGQGRCLHEISVAARSGTQAARVRVNSRKLSSRDDDILLWAIACVIIVAFYVAWRPWILVTLASLGILVGLAASLVAFIAWMRHIIAGAKTVVVCLLMPFIYSAVGIIVAALLWRAPTAPGGVRAALAACHLTLGTTGIHGFTYLIYTIAGGAFYVILALGTLRWQLSVVGSIYAAEGVRPSEFWRYIARHLNLPLGWGFVVAQAFVAILAVLFAAGWIYDWMTRMLS